MALPISFAQDGQTSAVPLVFHLLSPRNESSSRVTTDTGILDGADPSKYDPKNPLNLFIIQAGIIIIFCRLLEWPLSKIRQPRVISEVLGGIILGPSVMGRIPGFTAAIFPPESIPNLSLVANLGLLLFLFLIGVEVDLRFMASQWRTTLNVSIASLLIPFGFGAILSWGIYHQFGNEPGLEPISFPVFMLFVGLAISITAFPVLCRILSQLELLGSSVGTVVLAAGVANDVVGWILLALCVTLVNAGAGLTALWVLMATVGWTLFLFLAVKPLFIRYLHYTGSFHDGPTHEVIILTLLLTFVSAFFTSVIGVHAIFGAFLVGLICPHESGFAIQLTEKIEDLVSTIFLPLYFTLSGLSTNIGLLDNGITWAYVIAVIAVAFFSKVIGGTLGAKVSGMVWRESFTVGTLMSCKGLVELIVLNIGLQAKILATRTFTIFVVMALVTTFATSPIVMALYPPWYQQKLERWRRGEIDWDGNDTAGPDGGPTTTVSRQDKSRFSKVLVYLRADNMIPLLSITSLLGTAVAPEAEVHPSLKKGSKVGVHHDNLKEKTKKSVLLHGVCVRGLTERSSSVMRVSEGAELESHDPLLNSFKIGSLMLSDAGVSGEILIASSSYDDTLVSRAGELHSDLIVVPWAQSESTMESNTLSFGPAAMTHSLRSRLINSEYRSLVSGVFSRSSCAVAVLVHRPTGSHTEGLPTSPRRPSMPDRSKSFMSARSLRDITSGIAFGHGNALQYHIIVPYLGGKDDHAALALALQLSARNPGVTMSAIFFRPATASSPSLASSVVTSINRVRGLSVSASSAPPVEHEGVQSTSPTSVDGTAVISREGEAGTAVAPSSSHAIGDDQTYFASLKSTLSDEQSKRIVFDLVTLSPSQPCRQQIIDRVSEDIDAADVHATVQRECLVLTGRSIFRNTTLGKESRPSLPSAADLVSTTGSASPSKPAPVLTRLLGSKHKDTPGHAVPTITTTAAVSHHPSTTSLHHLPGDDAGSGTYDKTVPPCLGQVAADLLDCPLRASVLVVQAAQHGLSAGPVAGGGGDGSAPVEWVEHKAEV